MTDTGKVFRDLRAEQAKRRPRLVADARAEILRMLTVAEERIRVRLAMQPSEAEQWQRGELQVEVRRTMAEFSGQAAAHISTAIGAAWEAGQALVDVPLAGAGYRLDGLVPMLDTRQLVAMLAFTTDRIKDVGIQAANKINTELGLVVLGAQPATAAVTRVAQILNDASRSRAISIVRTNVLAAYEFANQQRNAQAAGVVPGLQKQWRRSGKVHSRIYHDLADGQVQDVDKPFKLGNGVRMMHPHDPAAPIGEKINCGCTSLPFKAEWEVASPKRKRFSEQEMQANPMKRELQEQLDSGKSINELLAAGKAA